MRIFLICLAMGAVSGVVYDLLYVVRATAFAAGRHLPLRRTRFPHIVTAVCDILYAAFLAAFFRVRFGVFLLSRRARVYVCCNFYGNFTVYQKFPHNGCIFRK